MAIDRRTLLIGGTLGLGMPFVRRSRAATGGEASVVLVAGQSNAMSAGTTGNGDMPSDFAGPVERVRIWADRRRRFESYEAGRNSYVDEGDRVPQCWGPELGFARRFLAAAPDRPLFVVKRAVGATYLARRAQEGKTDWSPETPGGYYHQLLDAYCRAGAAWGEAGLAPRLLGMIWVQGENDANDRDTAESYERNLLAFAARARADFASPDLRLAVARLPLFQARLWPHVPLVRQAQERVAQVDPRCVPFDTEDLSIGPDGVHYDPPSVVTLGERAYDALMS
ncbi:sialate O-acetylesterase [Aureimonas sp. ME7]|uniref:sialate O-acetylesterase n=1 Tax=Aureimonas sp. ME7 TaxID=2744252 RepID=UPI0015F56AC4|nr:sialate O-acetylesterase [Aureimonas sp. ME7]